MLVNDTLRFGSPVLNRRIGFFMDLYGMPGTDALASHIGRKSAVPLAPGREHGAWGSQGKPSVARLRGACHRGGRRTLAMTESEPITTDDLLDARMDETGLTREQLLLVVAKSALVRHLATGPDRDRSC